MSYLLNDLVGWRFSSKKLGVLFYLLSTASMSVNQANPLDFAKWRLPRKLRDIVTGRYKRVIETHFYYPHLLIIFEYVLYYMELNKFSKQQSKSDVFVSSSIYQRTHLCNRIEFILRLKVKQKRIINIPDTDIRNKHDFNIFKAICLPNFKSGLYLTVSYLLGTELLNPDGVFLKAFSSYPQNVSGSVHFE